MKKIIALVVVMFISSQIIAASMSNVKKCEISGQQYDNDGNALGMKVLYKNTCLLTPDEPSGSFSLSNPDKDKPLYKYSDDKILIVSVSILDKKVAEVRGLTSSGINSRWGDAKKSAKDKSCWVGEDFKICVE